MLFGIPVRIGALLVLALVAVMLLTNSYKRVERWIIGFVSLIGLSFLVQMFLSPIDWGSAAVGWVTPAIPAGSMPILMSVLGAVVMPHNLFLHSEIIQSRKWNLKDKKVIERQLKFEFLDTLFSMSVGWAINSAMILLAASTFFVNGIHVTELAQAQKMLEPLLGPASAILFAVALLFSGFSSSITAGMASGSIFAGFFKEPYDAGDKHSRTGMLLAFVPATLLILVTGDPFKGLVLSQMLLSIQLPITIFLQIRLTSSRKVMGDYCNSRTDNILLWACGLVVTGLNVMLLQELVSAVF
jgi:manganese transport protein